MYLCLCKFGGKKLTTSNTFVHRAESVDERVPCFSEEVEHDILSSSFDRFQDAVAPFDCTGHPYYVLYHARKTIPLSIEISRFSPLQECYIILAKNKYLIYLSLTTQTRSNKDRIPRAFSDKNLKLILLGSIFAYYSF